jgi:hypothetical protein
VEEFKLCAANARIDIAVINGHLHGYEIKSAADTLQRLPGQLEAYEKIFDFVTVVTENKYHQRLLNLLPSWVGLSVCIENRGISEVVSVKGSSQNNKKQGFYLAKLLWREDLVLQLNRLQIPFKKTWRNWLLAESLAENTDLAILSTIVRDTLKKRVSEQFYNIEVSRVM